jgi:hypothetical protein
VSDDEDVVVDDEEGGGVDDVVVVDEVDGGVEELKDVEVELEEIGVLVVTGGELLSVIELDGSEVSEGDADAWVDVGAAPASVLVELEDIVNCLLYTSFLGRLKPG